MKTKGDVYLRRSVLAIGLLITFLSQFISFLIQKFNLLSLHFNEGIAFSIPFKGISQLALSFGLLFAVVYFSPQLLSTIKKTGYKYGIFALGAIFGGGLSNMIERVAYGHVIDYFDTKIWPIFNLADTFITFGVAVMAILWFFMEYDIIQRTK